MTGFQQTSGRSVTSVRDARNLGTVTGLLLDPVKPRVSALRLRKPGGGSTVLAWRFVQAVGADAVMVRPGEEDEAWDAGLGELADKRYEVLGKRVLTEAGEEAGKVEDVEYDPDTGTVLSLTTTGGGTIDGRRVLGLGSYALVVRPE